MASVPRVFVLGGFQSDFARNLAREGGDLATLTREVVMGTMEGAGVDESHIQAIHVGNAFGELFAGQAQLGAMPATVVPGLCEVPSSRHEAACASGSIAVLGAMADIESGRYECVLVLGLEQERNVPGDVAARHLGAAAWIGYEGNDARFLWPHMFSRLADEYESRYGLRHEHLAAIARKNFDNARRNPLAQTRRWSFESKSFAADDTTNPIVEGRLRRQDCGQVTDGGAGVVLCSEAFVRSLGRDAQSTPFIAGWGHRTVGLSLDEKLARSKDDTYVLPHVRRTLLDAIRRAGHAGIDDLDGLEAHDCFTVTEYMIADHLGLEAPGAVGRAIDAGRFEVGGSLPINPSGGLIGLGHPVGATGVRMLFDASRQVSGRAEGCQVEGAKTFATLNIGGSATTVVSFVVRADQ